MSKIKLLILLSISIYFGGCASTNKSNYQFDVDYIGGGADGLVYSNYLSTYLNSLNIFNSNSNFKVNTSIKHNQRVYITNVNNTSDREMISSIIDVKITDSTKKCIVLKYNDDVQQFYVITSNINFMSNNKAIENIKRGNTEILTQRIAYYLSSITNLNCINE